MSVRQKLVKTVYDTIGFNPEEVITAQKEFPLFKVAKSSKVYQNLLLNELSKDVEYTLGSVIIRHNLISADANKPLQEIKRFFDHSFLRYKIVGTEYPDICLASLLPYSYISDGSTITILRKNKDTVALMNAIEMQSQMEISLFLDALTFPAATANKHTTLTGLTSSVTGFYIRMEFGADHDRPANG